MAVSVWGWVWEYEVSMKIWDESMKWGCDCMRIWGEGGSVWICEVRVRVYKDMRWRCECMSIWGKCMRMWGEGVGAWGYEAMWVRDSGIGLWVGRRVWNWTLVVVSGLLLLGRLVIGEDARSLASRRVRTLRYKQVDFCARSLNWGLWRLFSPFCFFIPGGRCLFIGC